VTRTAQRTPTVLVTAVDVPRQTAVRKEAFIALGARRSLAEWHVSQLVLAAIALIEKRLAAMTAHERPLTRVQTTVTYHAGARQELFVAQQTQVDFLTALTFVGLNDRRRVGHIFD
jgi:hypothetical protein